MIPDVASSDLPMSMPPEDSTTEGTGRSRRKHGRGKKKWIYWIFSLIFWLTSKIWNFIWNFES